MLVMRLDNVIGMCELEGYNEKCWEAGGWFPIDSVGFEIAPASHVSNGDNGNNKEKKPKALVSISKQVDSGTCNLMFLAMVHKTGIRGLANLNLKQEMKEKLEDMTADIHYVGTVASSEEGLSTFTFYMIHLEKVEVRGWDISASGDTRPTETLELVYEKAAACYRGIGKKGDKLPAPPAYWDQATRVEGKWPNMIEDYFPDYPKNT